MDFIETKGIVVGETQINEGDKILTIYTDKFGIISAKAPGAKSLKRKDMAGINMFALGDYILTEGRQYYTVRECNIVTHFFNIKKDIHALGVGCYILDCVRLTGMPDLPDTEVLRLALNCLYALSEGLKNPYLIKAVFEIKLCGIMGVIPEPHICGFCGEDIECEKGVFYDFYNCVFVCDKCFDLENSDTIKLEKNIYKCVSFIINSSLKDFLKFNLSDNYRDEFYGFAEKLFINQLEFTPKTLTYLKSLK